MTSQAAVIALILSTSASARAEGVEPRTTAERAAEPVAAVATAESASVRPSEVVASAARGAFGLQTGFGGGRAPAYSPVPGAVDNAPSPVGTVGLTYFAGEHWAVVGEGGLGVALAGGEPRLGFSVGVGTDYYLGTRHDALRPILHAGLLVERAPPNDPKNDGQELPWIEGQLGGGAAYFFHPRFSVAARVGMGVAWRGGLGATAPAGAVIVISTLLPAIAATWFL